MNIDLTVYGVVKSGKHGLCLIYLKGKYPSPKSDFVIIFVMPVSYVFNEISPFKKAFYVLCRNVDISVL